MNSDEVLLDEPQFLVEIDKSFVSAAALMDGSDLDWDNPSEECEMEMENRHHCGTCMVRTVMEEVWPSVERYIDWLKSQIPGAL